MVKWAIEHPRFRQNKPIQTAEQQHINNSKTIKTKAT